MWQTLVFTPLINNLYQTSSITSFTYYIENLLFNFFACSIRLNLNPTSLSGERKHQPTTYIQTLKRNNLVFYLTYAQGQNIQTL